MFGPDGRHRERDPDRAERDTDERIEHRGDDREEDHPHEPKLQRPPAADPCVGHVPPDGHRDDPHRRHRPEDESDLARVESTAGEADGQEREERRDDQAEREEQAEDGGRGRDARGRRPLHRGSVATPSALTAAPWSA